VGCLRSRHLTIGPNLTREVSAAKSSDHKEHSSHEDMRFAWETSSISACLICTLGPTTAF
jgi:hypothetical protein